MGTRQHPVVVVVGGGKMGSAVVSGWLASDAVPADAIDAKDVIVVNPGEAKRVALAERYGVATVADVSEITRADVVVLAVKPQVMMGVLEDISRNPAFVHAASAPDEGVLFVSVAAGLATAKLQAALPKDARLVRVMPNTPLTVGQGATGVCAGATATAEDLDYVHALFSCLGTAVIVDESLMDVVGALSGSGPAYVAAMVESLRDASVACGLDAQLAEQLALQTVYGTAVQILETGESVAHAREAVCSPGGSTLAALAAMDEAGFDQVFKAGIEAAVKRNIELGAC